MDSIPTFMIFFVIGVPVFAGLFLWKFIRFPIESRSAYSYLITENSKDLFNPYLIIPTLVWIIAVGCFGFLSVESSLSSLRFVALINGPVLFILIRGVFKNRRTLLASGYSEEFITADFAIGFAGCIWLGVFLAVLFLP